MPPLDDGILLPVQGGKALSDIDLGFQTDNEINGLPCDNISGKNDSYCELTVMYWAWKNLRKLYPDVKYVGLCHYRRLFAFRKIPFTSFLPTPESEIVNYRVDYEKVARILESGKIILHQKTVFSYSLMTQYCICLVSEDYRRTKEVIRTKFPDYYDDFIAAMEKSNKGHLYNMFIMKYEDFEKYCEWLFAVLGEVEPLIPREGYDTLQKRTLAVMAERLLNVYVRKNKLKVCSLNAYYYDEKTQHRGLMRRFYSSVWDGFSRMRGSLSFNLASAVDMLTLEWVRKIIKKLFSWR